MIYPRFSCKYLAFTQYFKSTHQAVDIPRSVTINGVKDQLANKYLYMAYEGKIIVNKYASDYGWYVEYEYKDGNDVWKFASGHMASKSSLEVGKTYSMGTLVGLCNKVGSGSTGFHDHFRVIKNGVRVDPLKVCYAYTDWNIQGSKEFAKLNWYTPIKVEPVERDTTKDQIKILKTLNVRSGAGVTNKIVGMAYVGKIFNNLGITETSTYTWYKIAENQYVAQDKAKTYIEVLDKVELISPEEDMIIKLFEKAIELLKDLFRKS